MMKITGLSHLFKWENLHSWWLIKYFFAPLYVPKVSTTPFRDQEVNWKALPREEADPAIALLCPVCALCIYMDRT